MTDWMPRRDEQDVPWCSPKCEAFRPAKLAAGCGFAQYCEILRQQTTPLQSVIPPGDTLCLPAVRAMAAELRQHENHALDAMARCHLVRQYCLEAGNLATAKGVLEILDRETL